MWICLVDVFAAEGTAKMRLRVQSIFMGALFLAAAISGTGKYSGRAIGRSDCQSCCAGTSVLNFPTKIVKKYSENYTRASYLSDVIIMAMCVR